MSTEWHSELRRRAALHAALGDAGRLAIADALALGDASPSQLQAELGMASNLLAHHVRVLQGVGVLARIRSEGDRRRTYLTLVPGALDGLTQPASLTAPRVVFVCTENAARSQLAAALWAGHSEVPAACAGTHPADRVHPGALSAARRHDLALPQRPPRRLEDVLRPGDVVITVCDRAHEELPASAQVAHWSVADPARSGEDAAYDRALRELTARVARIAPAIQPSRSA